MGKKSAVARAVAAAVLLGALLPGAGTTARAQTYENGCAGSHATIIGTPGDDRIRGTRGAT